MRRRRVEPSGPEPEWLQQLREEGARPGFREATAALGSLRSFAEFCAANDPDSVAGAVRGALGESVDLAELRLRVGVVDDWLHNFAAVLAGGAE